MSSNEPNFDAIAKIAKSYGVMPQTAIQGLEQVLPTRTQAQPKTLAVLNNAGFQWDAEKQTYVSDRGYQAVIVFPQRVYLWVMGVFAKLLKNTNELQSWLSGPSHEFMTKMGEISGIADPIEFGKPVSRPAPSTQQDQIAKVLQTIKTGSRLPADRIIDLYKMAKDSGNKELMNLVKTLQVQEGTIKRSELKEMLKEIVKGIFREMTTTSAVAPVTTPMAFSKKNVKTEEETIDEMTTTGNVQAYNIPAAFSRKGGSKKGVAGSSALGYDLTPIGKKDMERQGDPLYENKKK